MILFRKLFISCNRLIIKLTDMNRITVLTGILSLLVFAGCSTKSVDKASGINDIEQQGVDASAVTVMPSSSDGKVIELSDAELVAPGTPVSQLTVLDFNAVWCGPCRQLAPVVEEMAKKYQGKATFISIDVDKYGDLFEAYNLGNSIPSVVFLAPGKDSKVYVGTNDLLPAENFESIINGFLE